VHKCQVHIPSETYYSLQHQLALYSPISTHQSNKTSIYTKNSVVTVEASIVSRQL